VVLDERPCSFAENDARIYSSLRFEFVRLDQGGPENRILVHEVWADRNGATHEESLPSERELILPGVDKHVTQFRLAVAEDRAPRDDVVGECTKGVPRLTSPKLRQEP
jgi:hypothetical protein